MNKYKREFVEKVKQKFNKSNDLQRGKKEDRKLVSEPCDDKGNEILHSNRVDKKKLKS